MPPLTPPHRHCLVTFIDPHIFDSEESFRDQYSLRDAFRVGSSKTTKPQPLAVAAVLETIPPGFEPGQREPKILVLQQTIYVRQL